MTFYCLPFISPAIHIDKYYQTEQSCSSATDENLTQAVLEILKVWVFWACFQNKQIYFIPLKQKHKSCLP